MNFGQMIVMFKEGWPLRITSATDESGSPTNAVIKSFINQSARMAWKEVSSTMPERDMEEVSFIYPASTDFIPLPEQLRNNKIKVLKARPSGTSSEARILRAVRQESFVNQSQDGIPESYCVTGVNLWLRPRPSTDMQVLAEHVQRFPEMVDLDDEPQWIAEEHHDFIVQQALLLRKRLVGDDVTGLTETVAQMKSLFIMDLEQQQAENPVISDDNLGDYYE